MSIFNFSYNYFCHFLCVQLRATSWIVFTPSLITSHTSVGFSPFQAWLFGTTINLFAFGRCTNKSVSSILTPLQQWKESQTANLPHDIKHLQSVDWNERNGRCVPCSVIVALCEHVYTDILADEQPSKNSPMSWGLDFPVQRSNLWLTGSLFGLLHHHLPFSHLLQGHSECFSALLYIKPVRALHR